MTSSQPEFSIGGVTYKSYDDYVRAQYAGIEARRKLNDLPPSLLADARAFAESGLNPTAKTVTEWLKGRGTFGAVSTLVKDILRLRPVVIAANVV